MPEVSIIMPSYNRAWIIERAIKSVLAQSFRDFELIIVDDGSTDDTIERIAQINDNRLVIHRFYTNKGVAHARNQGLMCARGKFIAYLDTDNVWYSQYLEVMLEAFSFFDVMVYSTQKIVFNSGDRTKLVVIGSHVPIHPYTPHAKVRAIFIDINCTVHRKLVLDKVGIFRESLRAFEDWDLFERITSKFPNQVKHIRQVLSEYHVFLKNTAPTIENSLLSDEWILNQLNMRGIRTRQHS